MEYIGSQSSYDLGFRDENYSGEAHTKCRQVIFVEPMRWMATKTPAFITNGSSSEKIFCGKCNSKVGTFNWSNGVSCPCGVAIGPPGFLIQISRVDRCTMLKDIEASI